MNWNKLNFIVNVGSLLMVIVLAIKLHFVMSRQRENSNRIETILEAQFKIRASEMVQESAITAATRSSYPTTEKLKELDGKAEELKDLAIETIRKIEE